MLNISRLQAFNFRYFRSASGIPKGDAFRAKRGKTFQIKFDLSVLFCRDSAEKYMYFSAFTAPKFGILLAYSYLCSRLSGLSDSSAVGSVPRSGRGGREFESPLSDQT